MSRILLYHHSDTANNISYAKSLRAGLYPDFKTGLLTEREYLYSKNAYTKEIELLQTQLDTLQTQNEAERVPMDRYAHWIKWIDQYRDIESL